RAHAATGGAAIRDEHHKCVAESRAALQSTRRRLGADISDFAGRRLTVATAAMERALLWLGRRCVRNNAWSGGVPRLRRVFRDQRVGGARDGVGACGTGFCAGTSAEDGRCAEAASGVPCLVV